MKKRKIFLALLAFCLCTLMCLTGCGSSQEAAGEQQDPADVQTDVVINETAIQDIIDRGYLNVGCKTDVPDLSYYDKEADDWSGIEVELAYKTAARIFDVDVDTAKAENLAHIQGVTVANREKLLSSGKIDLMLATFTITDERAMQYAFSESYYTDYIGVMVRDSGSDSNSLGSRDINSIADLDGKYIGIPKNATTRKAFLNYIDSMNTIKTNPIFNEYESYDGLFAALKSGTIDAMSVDISILKGYVDSSTKILDIGFGQQKYGGAVLPENAAILDYLNAAITE